MSTGITLQSQSPGAAGADLGFRIASMVNGQPMAMRERELSLLIEAIAANRFTLPRNRKTGARITDKGTAILEIHGALFNRSPYIGSWWGASFYEPLAEQFARLKTQPEVKRVVLDIDSPGGVVTGINQCVAALEDLAEAKPVFAVAHDLAASAAYWLAAVAQEISVSPDGEVGSIGVRAGHVSYAEMLERDGIAVTMFTAGATKGDFSPYALLDDGAAAEEQFGIERAYDRFCAHVARHRPMTADEARNTDARTFIGEKAVDAKLADRVETLEALVARIERDAPKVKRKSKSNDSGSKAGRQAPASERAPARPDEDQPIAGNPTKNKGARLMSEHQQSAGGEAGLAEQIAAALAATGLRKAENANANNGEQASRAEVDADAKVAAALDRVFAILESDEGKARPKAALALAKEAGLGVETVKTLLASLPAQTAEAPASDSTAAELAAALDRQMKKPGNAAGVKPEADGSKDRKSFAAICAETASKKKG